MKPVERSHRYSSERKNKSLLLDESDSRSESEIGEQIVQSGDENSNEADTYPNTNGDDMLKNEELKMALETQAYNEQRIEKRLELREKNLNAQGNRPDELFLKKLDSSMKKNTTFIKKLRSINEQQKNALVNEFNGLNLSKFIQEAVTAMVEAKLKVSDVNAAAYMCSLFHQRYADFTVLFKQNFLKVFDCIGEGCKDEEKAAVVAKLRPALRLLGELVLDGFYLLNEGIPILLTILQNILNADKASFTCGTVVITLVRHCGEDLAGILPRKQRHWKETTNMSFSTLGVLSADQQSVFMCLFKEYYENISNHLVKLHKELQNREKQNRQTIGLRGELPADRKESFEKAQKIYEKILSSTTSLAELLDEEMPELPECQFEEREDVGTINIFTPNRGVEYDSETGLWEDDDTRTFYEDIKDLKILVPQIVFKEQDVPSNAQRKEKLMKDKKKKERRLRVDLLADDGAEYNDEIDDPDDSYEQDILGEDADDEDPATLGMAAIADAYFNKLPTCINRDFIDQAAEEFILKLNTKGNRKRLVKTLFSVNRTRLDLLPFYARLVSTLAPCLVDIAPDLVWLLKGSFLSHLRKKDQIHSESKIKTVRFIGELTKFKVCPKAEALYCLKVLLDKFTHHNIDMACNLIETCGRFLYRSPESHSRMSSLLEQMMRKKAVQAFDTRHSTMIENAFYYCNPPERQKLNKKVREPIHEYIRKLVYKDLFKTTTEKVLRQIRKLPWNDSKIVAYVARCLTNIWNVKFNNIRCVANMLSGLAEYHEDLAICIIDGTLENIRLGMETNIFRDNQRRICCMKYLGEMYNYQLVDSDIIFNTLYMLITFGSCLDMAASELDPPENLFRIRLVCTLLDTCGQYFDRGSSKKKLDYFLIFFQCYIWQKKESDCWNEQCPFPKEVEYMVHDTFESLRPSLKLFTSLEDAKQAAEELNKEFQNKFCEVEKNSQDNFSNTSSLSSPMQDSPQAFSFAASQSSQEEEDRYEGEDEYENKEDDNNFSGSENDEMFTMDNVEQVVLLEKPKLYQCEEDDFFCKQFERMIGESVTERLQDNMVTPNLDIAIPMNLKGKHKKMRNNAEEPVEHPQSINFVMMLKKNNKQILKDLPIPITSDLAANMHDKQKAKQAEHEEMKRLVLDYNQRQEEESLNEIMAHSKPIKRASQIRPFSAKGMNSTQNRIRDTEQQFFGSSSRR
ncbi:regulator of nonsense transcripts 2 isoform X1 [Hydra vulgaris]|nr:regulator of nonsense transcripts 2 [Hydra vulgaris]XP_047122630.1 regulator of nonsense transcripts 2 [Hydra vulgaris]